MPSASPRPHHLGEILEVDLVADAGARRHDAEVVEGLLAPAQELVALAVALELHASTFSANASGPPNWSTMHRVVDDQIDRDQRIDLRRVAAAGDHRVAHRGEVDDGGHAGEVLHQHARRPVGDLPIRAPRLQPLGDRLDVLDGDACGRLRSAAGSRAAP